MNRRTRNLRLAAAFSVLMAVIGGLLIGLIAQHGRDQIPPALLGLFFAIILVATFAGMRPWWRKLDHMQRDGHLSSWYWGGSFGGGLGLLLIMLVDRGAGQFLMGAALVWVAQIIGYCAALLGWKIAHRSEEA